MHEIVILLHVYMRKEGLMATCLQMQTADRVDNYDIQYIRRIIFSYFLRAGSVVLTKTLPKCFSLLHLDASVCHWL